MTDILMSDSIKNIVDPSQFEPKKKKKALETTADSPDMLVNMKTGQFIGQPEAMMWDRSGRIVQVALSVLQEDVQKVLEGNVVVSMGFRPNKDAKTFWLTSEIFKGISHSIEFKKGSCLMTVNVHY